jgi:hypothetical protein
VLVEHQGSRPRRPHRAHLAAGLVAWFDHAIDDLADGLTEDPAGVAEKPIALNEKMTRTEVVARLERSHDRLVNAVTLEKDGYPLQFAYCQ